jgi:hypothetical protein
MDNYTFLLISVGLLPLWVFIFTVRKDLRKKILLSGFIGGFVGIISEFWYFTDYWRPPQIINGIPQLEDYLFGFLVTGISVSIYDLVFSRITDKEEKPHKKLTLLLFFIGLVSLLVFNNFLNINSILVSSLTFNTLALVMIYFRRDLLKRAVGTGLLLVIVITPIYVLLFDWVAPEYWAKYWLLAGNSFGITILGNVPLTELLWYFSWGFLGGIIYDFTGGYAAVKK